ncbi:hypothetical protein C8Q70DRAFT_917901 [Cubamyces menziesii]|nr:hypothetical protein C8Q70DRAFT_917901 [Cubamyces menziesii]
MRLISPSTIPALLTYEYIITFNQEVALFWQRKLTGASMLFLCTRYLALISYNCLSALTYASWSDSVRLGFSCLSLIKTSFPFQILQYLVWAAFSALRTLALSRMNWPLAAVVFTLASGPFFVNVVGHLLRIAVVIFLTSF